MATKRFLMLYNRLVKTYPTSVMATTSGLLIIFYFIYLNIFKPNLIKKGYPWV